MTYVPARNSIFLAVALGVAEARGLDAVWIGVNAIDYSGYPDCRPEFIEAFRGVAADRARRRGVEGDPIDIRAPLIDRHQGRDRPNGRRARRAPRTHLVLLPGWATARCGDVRRLRAAGPGIRRGRGPPIPALAR